MIARLFFKSYKMTMKLNSRKLTIYCTFSHAVQFVNATTPPCKKDNECLVLRITFCVLCLPMHLSFPITSALGTVAAGGVPCVPNPEANMNLVHLLTWQTHLPQPATRNAKFWRYCSIPATSRRTKLERNFDVFPSLVSSGCKFFFVRLACTRDMASCGQSLGLLQSDIGHRPCSQNIIAFRCPNRPAIEITRYVSIDPATGEVVLPPDSKYVMSSLSIVHPF